MNAADETIPHRQRPADAPHENKNDDGLIVGDSTESSGTGETAWGTTADLTPENADEASVEGYANSTRDFENLHLPEGDSRPETP